MAPGDKARDAKRSKKMWLIPRISQQLCDPSFILHHRSLYSRITSTLEYLIVTPPSNLNSNNSQCGYTNSLSTLIHLKVLNHNPKIIFTLFHQYHLLIILNLNKIRRYIIPNSPPHDFPPIRITLELPERQKPKLRPASLGGNSSLPGSLSVKTQNAHEP